MKKKTLCGMMTAIMLLGVCPATVLAEDDMITLKKPLDFRNIKEDCSDEKMGWKWKSSSQKLILENFRVTVPQGVLEEEAVIYLPDESKIEIEGKNNYIKTESYHCDVFYCEGELLISNDGKIEISTGSMGSNVIFAKKGPVIIDDEVEMTIEPLKGKIVRVENAKGKGPIISIQDEAVIKVLVEEMDKNSIFITYKKGAIPTDKWVDLAEKADEWDDEYINLVSKGENTEKDSLATPPETEIPSEETPKQSTYQITIGNKAIKKDGYVTYVSDAKPYLSHGYTMLPLRALLNVTGPDTEIAWDAVTKTVTVRQNSDTQYTKTAYIVIGDSKITTPDGKMDVYTPAELQSSRAFVSLRDWMNILSALDMPASDLSWDPKTQTVTFVK